MKNYQIDVLLPGGESARIVVNTKPGIETAKFREMIAPAIPGMIAGLSTCPARFDWTWTGDGLALTVTERTDD